MVCRFLSVISGLEIDLQTLLVSCSQLITEWDIAPDNANSNELRLSDAWDAISKTAEPFGNQSILFKLHLLPGIHSLNASDARTCSSNTQCTTATMVKHEPKMNGSVVKLTMRPFTSRIVWTNGPSVLSQEWFSITLPCILQTHQVQTLQTVASKVCF
jgi:hypothetical protein